MFAYAYKPICDACIEDENKIFDKVRDHLKENPGMNVDELSKATEVSAKKIFGFIREGRLELFTASIACEKCDTLIKTGRFCKTCAEKFEQAALSQFSNSGAPKGTKMFTDRSDRKKR